MSIATLIEKKRPLKFSDGSTTFPRTFDKTHQDKKRDVDKKSPLKLSIDWVVGCPDVGSDSALTLSY